MIFFLLKNRRLSLHLFLGVLFLIGTMPSGSEGQTVPEKCYECTDVTMCGTAIQQAANPCATPTADACKGEYDSSGTLTKGECIQKPLSPARGECKPGTAPNTFECTCLEADCNKSMADALAKGAVDSTQRGGVSSSTASPSTTDTPGTTSSTTTDGNGPSVPPPTPGPDTGTPDGAGLATANGKLIFTILMTPPIYYGYIRGGMATS